MGEKNYTINKNNPQKKKPRSQLEDEGLDGKMGQGRKRDGSGEWKREEERSAETTFTSGGACRHDGGAMGRGLVLGFTDITSLLPLAWAWHEWWECEWGVEMLWR